MQTLAQIILISGIIVMLIGIIGLFRFTDFFARLNSAGLSDTLGAQLILIALVLLSDDWVVTFKLLLMMLLIFFIGPVISHALAKMADDNLPSKKTVK